MVLGRDEGCCLHTAFPCGTRVGGTQEEELSGGQRPPATPRQKPVMCARTGFTPLVSNDSSV